MTQLALELGSRDDRALPHVQLVQSLPSSAANGKSMVQRATGRFYTHELIGRYLARELAEALSEDSRSGPKSVADPFCGDGRLIGWLLEETQNQSAAREVWFVDVWDCDGEAVKRAVATIEATAVRLGRSVCVRGRTWDTFAQAPKMAGRFDIVITNPPWEQVKPDHRELSLLADSSRSDYVRSLRQWSGFLAATYPAAQPKQRFAGWGMNLARVGTDAALRLTAPGGLCGVVSPASFFADTNSEALRRVFFECMSLRAVAHFPAEARLFDGVDVPCIAFVGQAARDRRMRTYVSRFSSEHSILERQRVMLDEKRLQANGWVVPTAFGAAGIKLLARLGDLSPFSELEASGDIWAGRELDETRKERYLSSSGVRPFAKGVNIRRFGIASHPTVYVNEGVLKLPPSVDHPRLAWRDVSRPNQKRRVQATLIPSGWVTGNSLGVAYSRSDNMSHLAVLLSVFNSLTFEYQLRASLSTGHISLSSVRRVRVPQLSVTQEARLAELAIAVLDGSENAETKIEIEVGRAYGLDALAWELILDSYPKLTASERERLAAAWCE